MMRGIYFVFIAYIFCFSNVWGWGSLEMQMFDLVEEVKISFYDYLGVDKSATNNDIRRAYRKLSVSMHPDKNSNDPDADAKFRQLVGIYEVLKDPDTRERYDDVLENGLPDWKTTVYYYRKLRRMSNAELFIIFSVLCTAVHYAVLWGVRFEKALTLEDQLSTVLKRHKARDRKREAIDMQIAEELSKIPKPKWHDILPFAIIKGIYAFISFLPTLLSFFKGQISEKIEERRQLQRELVEEHEEKEKFKREKQERKRRVVVDPSASKETAEVYGGLFTLGDIPATDNSDEAVDASSTPSKKVSREWTEEDITSLVNAVARYPGGVPGRWERIAECLNRSVAEVTSKAKELGPKKLHYFYEKSQMSYEIPAFETNENPVCGESSEDEDGEEPLSLNHIVSQPSSATPANDTSGEPCGTPSVLAVDEDGPYLSRKKQKALLKMTTHKHEESRPEIEFTSSGWTQVEQKQLEVAIRSIPKGTLDRWDRIADCVPTKSKMEIMERVKQLSSIIKNKAART